MMAALKDSSQSLGNENGWHEKCDNLVLRFVSNQGKSFNMCVGVFNFRWQTQSFKNFFLIAFSDDNCM